MAVLRASDVYKTIGGVPVLQPLSLTLFPGQKLAIAGETGSGKTTLLRILAALEQPDGGRVYLNEEPIRGPLEKLIPGHPAIAYLSQHFELRNNYRVADLLGIYNQLPPGEAARVYRLCEIDHLLQRRTHELSGGERQRVALARELVRGARWLLLDEPYSNLDRLHKERLQAVLENIAAATDTTLVLVSHDPEDLLSWADRLLVMQNGAVCQEGTAAEIYFRPVSTYVAGLLGPYSLLSAATLPEPAQTHGAGGQDSFLVRPAQWRVVEAGTPGSLPATVHACQFYGAYVRTTLHFRGQQLVLFTSGRTFETGDTVHLQLPDKLWKLPRS